MTHVKIVFAACAMAVVAACASSGIKVDPDQVKQFEKGATTYDDVIVALGNPSQTILDADGNKRIMYNYFSYTSRAESFIPVVGLFASGADTENSNLTVQFDSNDVLTDYTFSSGQTGVGTGILSAGDSADRTDQPTQP